MNSGREDEEMNLTRAAFDTLLSEQSCILIPRVKYTKEPIKDFPLAKALDGQYITGSDDLKHWRELGYDRAIVMGAPSKNLICLDFDSMESCAKFFDSEKNYERTVKETFATKTSRGVQLLFRDPEVDFSKLPSKIEDKDKLNAEILIHHRLAACPLNTHPSGAVYQWLGCGKILEKVGIVQAFLDRFESLGIRTKSIPKRFNLDRIKDGVNEGSRHNAALSYSVFLLGRIKLDFDVVWFELQRWNALNKPPISEKELESIVSSAVNHVMSKEIIKKDAKW